MAHRTAVTPGIYEATLQCHSESHSLSISTIKTHVLVHGGRWEGWGELPDGQYVHRCALLDNFTLDKYLGPYDQAAWSNYATPAARGAPQSSDCQ